MTSDLGLPPRRELPPEVRARLRASVMQGIRPRRTASLTVTAAVVLVGLFVSVVLFVRPHGGGRVAVEPGMDAALAQSTLDRCRDALQHAGKRVLDWIPVFTLQDSQLAQTMVAAEVHGKPVFCLATATTVTVSDPDAVPRYLPGTKTAILLRTPTGAVAGVADPAWDGVDVVVSGAGLQRSTFSPRSHAFALFATASAGASVSAAEHTETGGLGVVLPPAPGPLLSTVDRPVTADRSSPAGAFLGRCLARSDVQIPDGDAYQAGAYLADSEDELVVARFGARAMVCLASPVYHACIVCFVPVKDPALVVDAIQFGGSVIEGSAGQRPVLAGIVPPSATRVTVTLPNGQPQDAVYANGTFLIQLPSMAASDHHPEARVQGFDATGKVVCDRAFNLQ